MKSSPAKIVLATGSAIVLVLLLLVVPWIFSSKALYPEWGREGLEDCPGTRGPAWGPRCGNIEHLETYRYTEESFPSEDGSYATPAWHIPAAQPIDLGAHWRFSEALPETLAGWERAAARPVGFRLPPGQFAAIFVHGGGADRREGYRFIAFFLRHGFDYYMPDVVCHGRADCPERGLSFGVREHQDVLNLYRVLRARYRGLILAGTSVGSNSILVALPEMDDGVVALAVENPMFSLTRFVEETPAAPAVFPTLYRDYLAWMVGLRGGFDRQRSPFQALSGLETGPPVFFMHSREDALIPWEHARDLSELYRGPHQLWILEQGGHARLWNADPADYERRLEAFLKPLLPQS